MNNRDKAELMAREKLAELALCQSAIKTPEGQIVMEHLRKVCGADKSCYRPGDPHATSFVCGLRDAYLLMLKDAKEDISLLAQKLKRIMEERTNGVHDQR